MNTNNFFHSYGKAAQREIEVGRRYSAVASAFGWMLLSMLGHSIRFRSACYYFDPSSWDLLMHGLSQNHISLELFFKVRCLDWMTPLRRNEQLISRDVLNAYLQHQQARELPTVFLQEPHSYVLPSDDAALYRPSYQGILHLPSLTNTFNVRTFPMDPSVRNPNFSSTCAMCGSLSCGCQAANNPRITRPLTELIHDPINNKGIGVRTLQRIHQGDILGEYVGELTPASSVPDFTYAVRLDMPSPSKANPVFIDATVYGNWTRYLGSSSLTQTPNIRFVPALVGKRHRMLVLADRDIEAFETLSAWLPSYVSVGEEEIDEPMCTCGYDYCDECFEGNAMIEVEDAQWEEVVPKVNVPNGGGDQQACVVM
ncbi:MAG: hypothetical protein Q9220_000002 [cf. Caloplaca sp. 1 TL-2023]